MLPTYHQLTTRLAILCMVVPLLFACQKEDDSPSGVNPNATSGTSAPINALAWIGYGSPSRTIFSYNEKGQLTSMGYEEVEYNTSGKVVSHYIMEDNTKNVTRSFAYNGDLMTRWNEFSMDGTTTEYYEFEYRSNGQIAKITSHIDGEETEVKITIDARGNVEQMILLRYNDNVVYEDFTMRFEYDDKPNPFYMLPIGTLEFQQYFSRNNPVRCVATSNGEEEETDRYRYEYNENEYPISKYMDFTDDPTSSLMMEMGYF